QSAQTVGVALHQRRVGEARTQDAAEARVELDENEPRGPAPRRHQRFSHRAGARPELDHRSVAVRIDIARHGARQNFSRRRHRADRQRPLDPGTDEAHLVIDPNAALALELPDLLFDLLADAAALLFEHADLAFDLALDDDLPDLQKPELALNPSFKFLQGRERHGINRIRPNNACSRTFTDPRPAGPRIGTFMRNSRGSRSIRREIP